MEHAHLGSSHGTQTDLPDPRINQLDQALREVEAATVLPSLGLARDPSRSLALQQRTIGRDSSLAKGYVVHSLPRLGWYLVQTGPRSGTIPAYALSPTGLTPAGGRALASIRAGDIVMLEKPRGSHYGIILGVVPPQLLDASVVCPDWLAQGGGTGLDAESFYGFPVKSGYQGAGVIDWSAGRPLDQTTLDVGWVFPTGLQLTANDFAIQISVNEQCGITLAYYDGYMRLAAETYVLETLVHEESTADDEGEAYLFRGVAAYPWEALGLYAPSQEFVSETSPEDVAYKGQRGALDLKEGQEDLQPFYRTVEFGGYLGQGSFRAVVAPAKRTGFRQFRQTETDPGVFREATALDGSYSLLSASSIHIGRRARIVVPKATHEPDHPQGDDQTVGGYRSSGQDGRGPEHKIKPLEIGGPGPGSITRVASSIDLSAWAANWQTLHPFHYHEKDFSSPEERAADGGTPFRIQDNIDFSALSSRTYLPDPTPKRLFIDPRYGEVEVIERESFLHLFEDGSIQLASGCGCELVMAGGRIRLAAPGGIELLPGTDFLVLAAQAILRAAGSIDLSSGKDLRLQADSNVQVSAGQGLLLESLGEGIVQEFEGKYGEDVRSAGVILRAPRSGVLALSSQMYFRTSGGNLVFDADRGNAAVAIVASSVDAYVGQGVTIAFGPRGETSDVRKTYAFREASALIEPGISTGGAFIAYGQGASVTVNGSISAIGQIATAGAFSSGPGGPASKVPAVFRSQLRDFASQVRQAATLEHPLASERHRSEIVRAIYVDSKLGDAQDLARIQFSFRDPPDGNQYHTEDLTWPETRWQQMARLGLGSGGLTWEARPVRVQGNDTYPWPGRKQWKDGTAFLQLPRLQFFDAGAGVSADRPGPYESPRTIELTRANMSEHYKLVRID